MTFASVPRWLVSTLLLSCFLCAGCDRPFQPYLENSNIPFSLLGYLDLEADTQWVRVMPVRQNLILGPDSIDAVVTLAKVGSGHPVTMRDSLFDYIDPRLGATVYAHNFWTTERLDPGAEYEIRAVRSDGAATTAHLTMPPHLEFSLLSAAGAGLLRVRATRILFVEVIYTMGLPYDSMGGLYYEPASSVVERAPAAQPTAEPGTQALELYATGAREGRAISMGRKEIRVAVADSNWPYDAGLSDLENSRFGTLPSNVDGGFGFVGAVATRTIPFVFCQQLQPRADGQPACDLTFNAQSTSISGRLVRAPCNAPVALRNVGLTEIFPAGGAIRLNWQTGWDGRFRFEGLEPGADLVLDLGAATPVALPRLVSGQEHLLGQIAVPGDC